MTAYRRPVDKGQEEWEQKHMAFLFRIRFAHSKQCRRWRERNGKWTHRFRERVIMQTEFIHSEVFEMHLERTLIAPILRK